jgi:uncharacterized RDD family membrane protein YckC
MEEKNIILDEDLIEEIEPIIEYFDFKAVPKLIRLGTFIVDQIFLTSIIYFTNPMIKTYDSLNESKGIKNTTVIIFFFISFAYFFISEWQFKGKTLGKYVTFTRAVDNSGHSMSFLQLIFRTFARFIPFNPFSFIGKESNGWHDLLSSSMVVYESEYKAFNGL